MNREAKNKALELIKDINKATSYQYQEYAGANYSTFTHDKETLVKCALLTAKECRKTSNIDNFEFWKEVENELEKML